MSYVEQLRRQKQLEHYQEDDPWGKEQADAIAEFGTNVMEGVVGGVTDWWKRSSADQEGWFDDALRLAAGGVKNVAAAAEDQEGYLDDALRLAGGGVKNTLNVLGAPGYVGGKIGGAAIGALGGDRRLGEWGGGFLGEIVLGGYAAKGLKVARAGTQYARLSPFQRALQYGSSTAAMESAAKHTGKGLEAFKKGAKIAAKKEFAGEIALAGKVQDVNLLMQAEGLNQAARPGLYAGLPMAESAINVSGKGAVKLQKSITDWIRSRGSDLEALGNNADEIVNTIKKEITTKFNKPGIMVGGKPHRVGSTLIKDVLADPDGATLIALKDNTSAMVREWASNPVRDPRVQDYFGKKGFAEMITKQGGDPAKINLEEYGKYVRSGAAQADRTTQSMAKLWGWKKSTQNAVSEWLTNHSYLDKEHAMSLYGGASNDWVAQFYGSGVLNRSQGKFNSFTAEVMEILGAPTNKRTMSWDSKLQKHVRNTDPRAQWNANEQSAVNWVESMLRTGASPRTLKNNDWLRVQQAFAKGKPIGRRGPFAQSITQQEAVAMKVAREREIILLWEKYEMPTDATSLKVLKEALDKWWDVGIKKVEAQAAKEADISKLLLERTIGAEAGKKANREMFQIAKKGKGKLQRKQYTRAEGTTIQPPGAKIDPDTGVPYSRVQLNIGKTKPAPHSKIHGKLELDLEAQDFNYIESILEEAKSPADELRAAFGEMQDTPSFDWEMPEGPLTPSEIGI